MNRMELAAEIVEMAAAAGASASEVLIREGTEFTATVRLGVLERLQQAAFRRLGIRILAGRGSAVCATSDFTPGSLRRAVDDTLSMARAAGEDPFAGLPEREDFARPAPELHLAYPSEDRISADDKIAMARECEQASMDFDPRINNSEGASFNDSFVHTTFANSMGISSAYSKSVCSLCVTPLAELNGCKQRDHWLSTTLDIGALPPPREIGAEAARRTLRRLGARKIATCEVPVVFEPLAAAAILRHVADAVSGTALVRKASFLEGKLGQRVANECVTMYDDALLPFGPGSRPFDSEGVPSQTTVVISDGVLTSYIFDSNSARRLGLRSTGNSNREPHGSPSVGPSNFHLAPGRRTPEQIVGSIRRGLYVTELIGFGVNIVSGDFSQGAAGLWIEDGQLAFPVEEITVAGNLKDMLTRIEAVGNDLPVLGEIFSPTLLIGSMVVSGN